MKMEKKQASEASADSREVVGPPLLGHDFFELHEEAIDLKILAPFVMAPDVTVKDIEEKLRSLTVYGPFSCPEFLLPAIRPKLKAVFGPISSYPCSPSSQVAKGTVILDEHYVRALDDGTELAVIGSLYLPQVLPNKLLEQKLERLYVTRGIQCHEENAAVISRLLYTSKSMTVIPAGFELVDVPLVLSNTYLETRPAKKLFCKKRVQLDPDVDASLLDDRLERLIGEDLVFCPAGLKEVIARKCKWPETQVVLYEGDLWIVDDARDLPSYAIEALEGKATLVVLGELTVDPQLEPALLAEKLTKVHNLGMIWCTPGQQKALQEHLGLHSGAFQDSARIADSEEGVGGMGVYAS